MLERFAMQEMSLTAGQPPSCQSPRLSVASLVSESSGVRSLIPPMSRYSRLTSLASGLQSEIGPLMVRYSRLVIWARNCIEVTLEHATTVRYRTDGICGMRESLTPQFWSHRESRLPHCLRPVMSLRRTQLNSTTCRRCDPFAAVKAGRETIGSAVRLSISRFGREASAERSVVACNPYSVRVSRLTSAENPGRPGSAQNPLRYRYVSRVSREISDRLTKVPASKIGRASCRER